MQVRGFLYYRLKYRCPKVFYCICQPNELEREINKKTGGQTGGQTKIWGGHGLPRPLLRIATAPLASLFSSWKLVCRCPRASEGVAEGGFGPHWILKFSAKKGCFLGLSGKKISPLLVLLEKFKKNPLVAPLEKILPTPIPVSSDLTSRWSMCDPVVFAHL